MPNEQLQSGPGFVPSDFEKRTSGYGGAMQGGQILVVGFVARINGLTVLVRDKRVDDARLKIRGGKRPLHDVVITARALDGDQAVLQLMLLKGVTNLSNGGIQR